MDAKPAQIQHPHKISDIFQGVETEVFGPNGREIVRKLDENQRWLEDIWEVPKESFTLDGSLTTGESPRGKFRIGGRAAEFEGTLKTAGSSDTEIDLFIDGSFVNTLVIPAGETYATMQINRAVSRNSVFYVDITTAGSGAESLVTYVHMIPDLKQAKF